MEGVGIKKKTPYSGEFNKVTCFVGVKVRDLQDNQS